jgi:hypothetical protein
MTNGWGGPRPNSGRPTTLEKNLREVNLSLFECLAHDIMLDESIPKIERVKLLLPLAIKHTKSEVDITNTGELNLNLIRNANGSTEDISDDDAVGPPDGSV